MQHCCNNLSIFLPEAKPKIVSVIKLSSMGIFTNDIHWLRSLDFVAVENSFGGVWHFELKINLFNLE
jgi:hypothetical protein